MCLFCSWQWKERQGNQVNQKDLSRYCPHCTQSKIWPCLSVCASSLLLISCCLSSASLASKKGSKILLESTRLCNPSVILLSFLFGLPQLVPWLVAMLFWVSMYSWSFLTFHIYKMIRINSRNCADFQLIFHNGAVALVPRPTTLQLWQMDQIWFQTKPSKLSHFTGNVKLVMIKRDGFLWQISRCIFYQKCKIDTHLTTQSNRSQGTRETQQWFSFS